jgi:hypothetical protein
LREGETLPITLVFDNRNEFRVTGTATRVNNFTFVQVPMPDDSRLITSFTRAYGMEAFARGNRYAFNLTNTAQLLPAIMLCVVNNVRGPGAAQPTQTVGSLRSDEGTVSDLSPELQIEAIQLATNFMLRTQLRNPRVSRADWQKLTSLPI